MASEISPSANLFDHVSKEVGKPLTYEIIDPFDQRQKHKPENWLLDLLYRYLRCIAGYRAIPSTKRVHSNDGGGGGKLQLWIPTELQPNLPAIKCLGRTNPQGRLVYCKEWGVGFSSKLKDVVVLNTGPYFNLDENQATRPTSSSLGWTDCSDLFKLYIFVVSESKEPFFELLPGFTAADPTPLEVFLDLPL
jgi:hypothetical protein